MISSITSPQNARVKSWSALLTKRGREEQARYLLEGVHLVQEALKAGAPIETILIQQGQAWPVEISVEQLDGIEQVEVSEAVLAKCSDMQTPQGIVAIVRKETRALDMIIETANSLVIIVDGIQDPGNLGTIVRSADSVGATAVLLGAGTVDLYNPKTIRATMGSLFHLPIVQTDLTPILEKAVELGIQVVGTSLAATHSCYDLNLTRSTWFVVGNEGSGVSPQVDSLVSERVKIPMPGQAESLNVAMASTVLLFEAMRQRLIS